MKHILQRLKSRFRRPKSKAQAESSDSDADSDRAFFETDSFHEEYKENQKRAKEVARCRQAMLSRVEAGTGHTETMHGLLQDCAAANGKGNMDLLLQNLALHDSSLALHLGQFSKAHCFLEALNEEEQLPATYYFRARIFRIQGFINAAAEQLRLALKLLPLPPPAQNAEKHVRLHDFLEVFLVSTLLDDWEACQQPNQGPQALVTLARNLWENWLRDVSPPDYDPVAVLILDLYLNIDPEGDDSVKDNSLLLLDRLISHLASQLRISEAFELFTSRIVRSHPAWDGHLSFLDHLATAPASLLPAVPAFVAELQLQKARWLHLGSSAQPKLGNKLIKSAEQNYKKCGHAWGHLDVRRMRIHLESLRSVMRSRSVEAELVKMGDGMFELALEYSKVEFPARMISALDEVADLCGTLKHGQGLYETSQYLRDACGTTGRTTKYWLHHLAVMGVEVESSADIGSFLQDCEDCPPGILALSPVNSSLRAKVMFYVAYRTGDAENVLKYGPPYLAVLRSSGKFRDASTVAEMMAAAQLVFDADGPPQAQRAKFESARDLLRRWIEDEAGLDMAAPRKLLLLAKGYVDFKSVLPDTAVEEARSALQRAAQFALSYHKQRAYYPNPEASIMEEDATFALEMANAEATVMEITDGLREAMDHASKALEVHGRYASPETQAALRAHNGRRKVLLCGQFALASEKSVILQDARDSLKEASKFYLSVGHVAQILECKYWEALALKELSEPEEAAHLLRSAVEMLMYLLTDSPPSSASTITSLQYKHTVIGSRDVRRIFNLGLDMAIAHDNPQAAWEWIQASKARSLSDMLKLRVTRSHGFEKFIDDLDWASRNTPYLEMPLDSLALVGGMGLLLTRLRTAPVEQRAWIKKEIRTLRGKMMQDPVLRASLDVLTGAIATLDDLRWMSLLTAERPIFLDWAAVDDDIYLICVKVEDGVFLSVQPTNPQRPLFVSPRVTMHKLAIKISEVERWRFSYPEGDRYLDRAELSGENAYDNFNLLRELIAPIATLSKEGDLLVLCPTGVMHGIPLHAIEIGTNADGESVVLLERNPVVYTYSHSVLRQCTARLQSRIKQSHCTATIFGVYDNPGQLGDRPEEIKYSLESLAKGFNNSSFTFGADVTEAGFRMQMTETTALIHFHGHTKQNASALEQAMVLTGKHPFKAKSVLELDLRNAPLVNLIACASVDQTTMPGDEPLGLLSAFLCAGACSAVGTLWPSQSVDGRAFSRAFYDSFSSCLVDVSGRTVVHVAKAVQMAALSIKRNERTNAPYHWAQWVLFGSWFCRDPRRL